MSDTLRLVEQFDTNRPIESSKTPPFAWYTDQKFYDYEVQRVLGRCWIPGGRLDQVLHPGDHFTSKIAGNPIVVVRDKTGELRAHHNVCRRKAAIVAKEEDETQHRCEYFQCPYHGWEYPLAVDKCRVVFDFYFDYDDPDSWEARKAMRNGIASSHTIQEEDIEICESAQRGMRCISVDSGLYSSTLECAVHAFHCLLSRELRP